MEELEIDKPVHRDRNQLPLYGLVYDPDTNEYGFTVGGLAIDFASRPAWEVEDEQSAV